MITAALKLSPTVFANEVINRLRIILAVMRLPPQQAASVRAEDARLAVIFYLNGRTALFA